MDIDYFDKISHVTSYFILMAWFAQLYHSLSHHIRWALFFILLGMVLEYLQALGGVRYFEWADMMANTGGVLLAFMLARTRFAFSLLWFERKINKFS